ncbi:MAG TPA: SRPBCC family protein [Actinomycetes bacterium]|nr:SRPBCC family protein [Actinomycetes bacterium]
MILRETVTVRRSPSEVFGWIADLQRARRWQIGVLDCEITEATPEVIGTRFRQTVGDESRHVELTGEVTDFQADELIEFVVTGRGLVIRTRYFLSAVGQSTRLEVASDVRLGGWVSVLLAPFVRGKSVKHLRAELERLGEACEGRLPGG